MAEAVSSGPDRSARRASDRFDPRHRRRLSGPALRTFFRIAEKWRLANTEQRILLGAPAESTFYNWRDGRFGALSVDTLERISLIFGVYKALHVIFPDDEIADSWVRLPNHNPRFAGASAIERMLGGSIDDLYTVRRHLDAWGGG